LTIMAGTKASLGQRLASCAVKLVQRFGPHTVRVLGDTYVVCPEVFNPKFYLTSEFMARHIDVRAGDAVLDVGTGSGIQAITAGRTAQRVVAVDINPHAVRCARENVRRSGLEGRVEVLEGDLFSPLPPEARFDVILFTPPYFEGELRQAIDHALYDPGKALAGRFLAQARGRLSPGGYVQMVYSSLAAPERVLRVAAELSWRCSVVAEKKALFETFSIYRLVAGAEPPGP
jgi:release factor glutamine methyltransferase